MSAVVTASLLPEAKPRGQLEKLLQEAVAEFLPLALPPDAVFHHSPGEGKRTLRAQRDLKRSGFASGWPDIEIIYRGKAIFIELKAAHGSLSAEQRRMHNRLTYCGARVALARSVPEVEALLRACGVPLRATVQQQQQVNGDK